MGTHIVVAPQTEVRRSLSFCCVHNRKNYESYRKRRLCICSFNYLLFWTWWTHDRSAWFVGRERRVRRFCWTASPRSPSMHMHILWYILCTIYLQQKQVVQLLRVHIISSIGLPLRPTTFCTTLLSYLKCQIIGISEYDRNCCTVCTTISTICTLIVTLGWGFRAFPLYAHTSKVRILLILVQLYSLTKSVILYRHFRVRQKKLLYSLYNWCCSIFYYMKSCFNNMHTYRTLRWGFWAYQWYAYSSKVCILLILVQLFC